MQLINGSRKFSGREIGKKCQTTIYQPEVTTERTEAVCVFVYKDFWKGELGLTLDEKNRVHKYIIKFG